MLILRSFEVAVAGLWRFVLVVPFLVALVFIITAVIATRSTLLGAIFFASGANLAMLVAMRTAFAQIGEYSAPSLWKLIVGGLKYWLIQTAVTVLLFATALMLAYLLTIEPGEAGGGQGRLAVRLALMKTMADPIAWYFFAVATGLSYILWTALLVPQAGVAWSSSENREPFDLFWGFGARFFALLPVVVVTAALVHFTDSAAKVGELIGWLVIWLSAVILGETLDALTTQDIIRMATGALVLILAAYWQAVAAALAFVDRREENDLSRRNAQFTPESERVDAAALRRAREQ